MNIWELDKLALFIGFVVPGFLSLKASGLLNLQGPRDSSQQLIDAVSYSCINYALLAYPIFIVETSGWQISHPRFYYAFYGFVLLVAPVLWAFAWRWLRTWKLLRLVLPHPTEKPWDYVFGQGREYWALVTFKDGREVGGRYGATSFSSSSPSSEQLYLEEAWVIVDGGFDRPRTDSAGILILGPEVSTVELFTVQSSEGSTNESATESSG